MARARRGAGEGSLWFRKDRGVWVAEYQGRRRSHTVKAEAAKLLALLQSGSDSTQNADEPEQIYTLGDAIDGWLQRFAKMVATGERAQETYDDYAQVSRDYLSLLRPVRLDRLTPPIIEATLTEYEADVSPERVLRTLRQALNYARAYGWMTHDPTSIIRPRHRRAARPEVIEPEQLAASTRCLIGDRLEHLFVVQLALGLSSGETYGLCWDKVDLPNRVAHIHRVKRKKSGIVNMTKAASRYRTVHIPEIAIEALQKQRALQDAWRRKHPLTWREHNPKPVFTTELGDPLNDSACAHRFRDLQERAEIEPIKLGKLRSAHSTIAFNLDVPGGLTTIADQLGHSDDRTTKKFYAAVAPRTSKKYAELIDAAIRRVQSAPQESAEQAS